MIRVLQLLDDGCLGKKGELLYFVENEDGFINTVLSFLWNDCGRIGKFCYNKIWQIVTRTAKNIEFVHHNDLGF